METPQSKTPSTDTLNPSTTPITAAETTAQPTSGNPPPPSPPKSPDSAVKRKRDEEDIESESDDLKKPKPASLHPLHKTSLCSYFRSNSGSCSHGETCRFAHNEEELRPRPDGSWDPTSLLVKRKESEEKRDAEDDEEGDVEEERSAMMTEVLGDSGDPQLSKCLIHLPRKWTSDQLKTYLDEQGVVFKLAKKKKGMSVGFLTFEAAEQVKSATELLGGKSIGKEKLKIGDVIPRSYDEKIKSAQKRYLNGMPGVADETEATLASNDTEDGEGNSSSSRVKSVRDAVTPLAHLSYAEQLEQKKNSLTQMLKKLTRNARKACPKDIQLPEWVVKSREIGGLPCKLEGIIESPLINGYRNKCEFSVGLSVQGKPTVGFMLGNFREGVTAVEEPTNCLNVSKIACNYASFFQEFLRDSALPIWNRFNNSGFWRQLTVREGGNPQKNVELEVENHEANITEVMLIVQVSTEGCDDDLVNSELEKLTQAFVNGAASTSPPLPLTVLALQDHEGISNVAPADAPLRTLPIHTTQSGSDTEVAMATNECRIHDYIGNLRFSISPTAFFQVNTLAAEKLYSLAGDWAGLGPDTLLFDVCCGTGTIGLTLANRVGMVVGIEMNASAVSDAQRNAEINAITNCKFICAKAEDVMGSLLREYLDDTSNPLDGDEKENGAAESQSVSLNEGDPEDCSNEVNLNTNHACGSDIGEQDLQSNLKDCNTKNGIALKQHFKNVVAIVDPPRSGLHPVVLKALRTHPRLKRLVYISCNPETLVANAIELCTPSLEIAEKGRKGQGWRNMSNAGLARHRLKSMPKSEPFQPVKAMAVDLFPHTPHCELVMLLESLVLAVQDFTTIDDNGSISCDASSNSTSYHVPGSSLIDRCFGKRRLGKRWKRRQYLQQRARQEKLHHSRKWKIEDHGDTFTIKSSEKCRRCEQVPLASDSISECATDTTCVEDQCKQSIYGENEGGAVFLDTIDDSVKSKKEIDLDNFNGIEDEANSEGENDTCCDAPSTCICSLGDNIDKAKESISSPVSKASHKCKRQSDKYLDNPKPRKSRRSTDDQAATSRIYNFTSFCGVKDHLPDGFYDAGRDRPFMSLRDYEQNLEIHSREVILLDRERDEELDGILLSAQAMVLRLKKLTGLRLRRDLTADDNFLVASWLALFVSDHFGGGDRIYSLDRVRKDVSGSNYHKPFVCTCAVGNSENGMVALKKNTHAVEDVVLQDICEQSLQTIKARRNSVVVPLGALQLGVCRHRAVLMKYLCDRMEPPVPCELIRGYLDFSPHAWNAVLVQKGGLWVRMIVDACRPHDIQDEMDPEYLCRYIPLTRIIYPKLAPSDPVSTGFPSISECEEIEKVASSSLILCKVGSIEAAAKVRTLEVSAAALDEIRNFEFTCIGEVRILSALKKHPCIVEIYGHKISSDWIPSSSSDEKPERRMLRSAIFMEYVGGGSLKNYIEKLLKTGKKHVQVHLALCIARDVSCALKELHSKHIIHRDIKSENILIDLDQKRADGMPVIKLSDFDRAVPLRSSLHTCCISHVGIPPPDICVGTPRWMAPEVLQAMHDRKTYGLEVDIWSYGCLLLELLTLQIPYSGLSDSNIHDLLQNGKRPLLNGKIEKPGSLEEHSGLNSCTEIEGEDRESEGLRFLIDLFHQCTNGNPDERPTAEDIYDMLLAKTSSFTAATN